MHHRQTLKDDRDPHADEYLDCNACQALLTEKHRRQWGCAWLKSQERAKVGHAPPGDCERGEVCAGYLVSMPQVIEAARASSWRKEGALREFYDGKPLTDLAKFSIDTVAAEARSVESYVLRKQREDMKNGSR